jgi:hypothetical protein
LPTAQQIRTEIDTDPKGLGYTTLKAQSNGPEAVAAKMNEIGGSSETLTPTWTATTEVLAVLVGTEVLALSQANRDMLAILTSTTQVKTGSATLRAAIAAIFASGTTSRTNLVALTTKSCSRAAALWGEGTYISATDVGNALELP